jgi:hypothetical protein
VRLFNAGSGQPTPFPYAGLRSGKQTLALRRAAVVRSQIRTLGLHILGILGAVRPALGDPRPGHPACFPSRPPRLPPGEGRPGSGRARCPLARPKRLRRPSTTGGARPASWRPRDHPSRGGMGGVRTAADPSGRTDEVDTPFPLDAGVGGLRRGSPSAKRVCPGVTAIDTCGVPVAADGLAALSGHESALVRRQRVR